MWPMPPACRPFALPPRFLSLLASRTASGWGAQLGLGAPTVCRNAILTGALRNHLGSGCLSAVGPDGSRRLVLGTGKCQWGPRADATAPRRIGPTARSFRCTSSPTLGTKSSNLWPRSKGRHTGAGDSRTEVEAIRVSGSCSASCGSNCHSSTLSGRWTRTEVRRPCRRPHGAVAAEAGPEPPNDPAAGQLPSRW